MIQAGWRFAAISLHVLITNVIGNDVTLPGSVVTADIGDRKDCVQFHPGFERMQTSCGLKSKQNYQTAPT